MAKFRFGSKKGWKKILTVGLGFLLFAGAVFGIARWSEKADETTKEISLSYEVGGLSKDGKYAESEESIYTKTAFECQGLKITPDFDSQVSYQVFFYDMNEQFMESTSQLSETFVGAPALAKYARIEITPQEDDKVSWYEVRKYAKQLNVEVLKNQNFDIASAIETLDNEYVKLGRGYFNHDTKEFLSVDTSDCYFFDYVDVSEYTTMYMKVSRETCNNKIVYDNGVACSVPYVYTMVGNNPVGYNTIPRDVIAETVDYVYLRFDVSGVNSVLGFFDVNSVDCCGIYLAK